MWDELVVFLLAMSPVSELRGALPVAINVHHISAWQAYGLAVVGNLAVVPILLLGLKRILKMISKVGVGENFSDWLMRYAEKRSRRVKRYEKFGLMSFVAIPLPITGAWTGSLVACVLGMGFWEAFIPIALGVLMAGVIVTSLCLLGWVGALVASVGLGVGVMAFFSARSRKQRCV